jgi:hypothetical protein
LLLCHHIDRAIGEIDPRGGNDNLGNPSQIVGRLRQHGGVLFVGRQLKKACSSSILRRGSRSQSTTCLAGAGRFRQKGPRSDQP